MLRMRVTLVLALLAGIPMVPFALQGGSWPVCHDTVRYFMLFDHFREAVGSGILYPRWLPELHGGFGYPTFVIYQPGFFFWKLPFSAFIGHPLWTTYASLYGLFLIGATGAWLLGRRLSEASGGYFAATLFMLTPYTFVELYIRCDLSELTALLVAPWPFALTAMLRERVRAGDRPAWPLCVGLVVALAALIYSHPVGLVLIFPVYAAFALWLGFGLEPATRLRLWLSASCTIFVALALSAPYWATIVEMLPYVNITAAFRDYYVPERHFVDFSDYVLPQFDRERVVFGQLGLPHLIAAMLGAFALRRNRAALFGISALALMLVLMSELAGPFWTLPIFRNMQFPWRMMCAVATLQVLCASGVVRLLPRHAVAKWLIVVGFFGASLVWYHAQFGYVAESAAISRELLSARRARDAERIWSYVAKDEYRPRWGVRHHPIRRPGEPMLVAPADARLRALPSSTKWRLRYQFDASRRVIVAIRQFYLPGWRVEIDGKPVGESTLRSQLDPGDGTMRVAVPAGGHRLEAWYDGPPGWQRRNLVILIITLAGLCLFGYLDWCAAGGTKRRGLRGTRAASAVSS